MNTNDFVYGLINIICSNDNPESLAEELKSGFSDVYDLSEINILFHDPVIKKLKNVIKDFEPAEDYFSAEKISVLNEIFSGLNTSNFVLNDDINMPDDIFDTNNITAKSLSVALKYEKKVIGILRLKFRNTTNIKPDDLKLFELIGNNLALKVMNIVLSKRIEVKSDFYKSMKNIAKIIETQYDFQYIIPIIGEILDKFVMNHLIYIFIKKDDKYTLFWPSACWSKKVYELIETITPNDSFKLTEDRKTGVFPLVSDDEITGCIVAHSTIDRLSEEEIGYLSELTAQSAITIERANNYSEILQNATTDALTGLNNRRQFEIRLKEQFAIANRQNSPLCAIMTDIDFFKKFNDNYGHSTGDEVLKMTAEVIKSELREYDIASRYGGEEFCILLPQTNIEEANTVAERLRSAVSNSELTIGENRLKVTISIGLAELDIRDMPEDLYMKADKALYNAKEKGRNRVEIYTK